LGLLVRRQRPPDGLTYTIDAERGTILTVRDLLGNTLSYSDTGVTTISPYGTVMGEVTFERDHRGRIVKVIDPDDNEIEYDYDAAGDLVSVTNREAETTQFAYGEGTAPDHYLTKITDARGVEVLRATYTNGRLTGIEDAASIDVALSNPSGGAPTDKVVDALGFATEIIYDDQGNPIRTIRQIDEPGNPNNAMYQVVVRVFSQNNDLLAESKPYESNFADRLTLLPPAHEDDEAAELDINDYAEDWASRSTHDSIGNVLTSSDALGNTSRYTYGPNGRIQSVSDPLGNTTVYSYTNDSTNRIRTVTDSAGNSTTYSYVPTTGKTHLLQLITGPLGSTSSFTYDLVDRLGSSTDPLGKQTFFGYDDQNRVENSWFFWDDPSTSGTNENHKVTTHTDYDDEGRVEGTTMTVVTDGGAGSTLFSTSTSTVYNSAGQMVETIDSLGNSTFYHYDVRGLLVEMVYPDLTPGTLADNPRTRTSYDALGRAVYTMDRFVPGMDANGTKTTYDGLGRVTKTERFADVEIPVTEIQTGIWQVGTITTGSLLSESTTVYDSEGRVESMTSASGQVTEYVYLANGWQESMTLVDVPTWNGSAIRSPDSKPKPTKLA